MSEGNKLEFAEALSIRYMQLAILADISKFLTEDPVHQKAEKDLHLLRTIIVDLPEDIQALVKQGVHL